MVEANPSLAPSRAQRQAERMRIAVRVEAQRRAREEVKAQIRSERRVKLASVPPHEITAMAEARPRPPPHSAEKPRLQLIAHRVVARSAELSLPPLQIPSAAQGASGVQPTTGVMTSASGLAGH